MDRLAGPDVVTDEHGSYDAAEVPRPAAPAGVQIPEYLRNTYSWAYLNPRSIRWLDTRFVVEAILWGNFTRLVTSALVEFQPGMSVLQPACVYGDLSPRLARLLGPEGRLVVSDVAPVQIANCRPKLEGHANATLWLKDAADHAPASVDAVCCFFLLHEVPAEHRRRVVRSLLGAVKPGGKIVFVDYHRPRAWHPLKPLMSLVFDTLEPFAKDLWRDEIQALGPGAERFTWRKETYFGGLYQKVVGTTC